MEKSKDGIVITAGMVLFFDMDGTLVDTNLSNFLAYKKAIESVTKSDINLTYNPHKRFNRSILKYSVANLTSAEYERIIQKKEKFYDDYLHETTLIAENVDILSKYSETNKTVLVTNCRKDRALKTLNYYGLTEKFTDLIFREFGEIKINKFQNALSALSIQPNIVIVFENDETEIDDAKKAGIPIENIIRA